ncbi:MAG: FIST C-terminal domain-containing protein [Deltaproteobacteria bacterium]|nr:FIST C-terminal domain-containing protein [Deltaproteobacteria bacterium]
MSTQPVLRSKIGSSFATAARQAVKELCEQICQQHMDGVVFFCSSKFDLDHLGEYLKETFPCPIIGCTTAGEVTSAGYHEGTLVGASLGGDTDTGALRMHSHLLSPLGRLSGEDFEALASSAQEELVFSSAFNSKHMFGLLLVDGMSMLEEITITHLHRWFRGVPIVGGSAGDDLNFQKTHVYHNGRFHSDAAVFTLFETTLPFITFKTQHFVPTETKLVITEADPQNRRVIEIDGEPAALAYANILGLKTDDLNPTVFSSYPLILQIGGNHYVRSIQKVNDDESLSFYCAIDNGLVLTLAKGIDLIENLQKQLSAIRDVIPNPELVIGCDCILRRLEVQEKDLLSDVRDALKKEKILGFSTYGEQFNAIHVNQTLTGVAIGGTP